MTTNDRKLFEELQIWNSLEKSDSWWAIQLTVFSALLRNAVQFDKFYELYPTYPVIFGVDLAESGSEGLYPLHGKR